METNQFLDKEGQVLLHLILFKSPKEGNVDRLQPKSAYIPTAYSLTTMFSMFYKRITDLFLFYMS